MGLYDRDYGRNERTPWDRIESPRSIAITLIVINVVVWLAQMLFIADYTDPETGQVIRDPVTGNVLEYNQLIKWGSVSGDTLIRPWLWWQFISYGFLHDDNSLFHLLFNMIGLFFFGRIMERKLGQHEFLRFYLLSILAGGIVGAVFDFVSMQMTGSGSTMTIGASGGVVATVILFACYFPYQEIYIMAILPIKAWIAATFFVLSDLAGALGIMNGMGPGSNTAFTVHLAGAAFAGGYFYWKWNFSYLDFTALSDLPDRMRMRARRAKLKIHDPDKKMAREADDADRILAKIHEQGESSLTSSERKVLQRYSKRQRQKREL
ncbi:Rhomboid family protein [Rubripirellula obstinata]|uniref:Rhomboid family protein n=1 Tax=Rubripirellula obstinata TaxID=406547 RepID=A0A5B1CP93_9BACT|nr:rhomboid family intramembrane serine protease [Rubripirellula obstinata]KAA1261669.1 Rhomboid family protein [Rubripirellula obstinata]